MTRPMLSIPLLILLISALAADPFAAQGPDPDPPPVDEEALARRLFEMVAAKAGERAIIVHDPTYYPGITRRLRESLHQAGVHTYMLVEDSPAMIRTYIDDDAAGLRREGDIVSTLLPLFRASDIFYWMPSRGYADDLRWERLVAESRVRSVHFHWMLNFPGTRTPEQIIESSRTTQARSLNVDLAEHARMQRQLAEALRGQTVRITTPAGTDLTFRVPRDQWFHLGDGDASRARAETARSIRDRQMELPVGMFLFVPDADDFRGRLVVPSISQAGENVSNARLELESGRIRQLSAEKGEEWIRNQMKRVGPDGDKIAVVSINTHPLNAAGVPSGVVLDIGSNWENGGKNRAVRMRRMTIRLTDATITTGAGTLMRDGRLGAPK